jgi:hypothetical protein
MANVRIVMLEGVTAEEASRVIDQALPRPVEPTVTLTPALPMPAALPAAPAPPTPKRTGRPHAQPGDDTIRGRVLDVILREGPKSSIELMERIDLDMNQVSTACKRLKESGRLESIRDDENDGTRRWFIPKQQWNRSARAWEPRK